MARKTKDVVEEIRDVAEVEAVPAPLARDLYSIDGITSELERTIKLFKEEHEKYAHSSHAVAQCIAGALWGALWSVKRQLSNEHGIKVNIDG